MTKENSSPTSVKIRLAGLLALPLTLYFIPLRWLIAGQTICLFKNITGHECYGCGITRALFSLLHGDLCGAYAYNRLIVIIAPLLLYLYIQAVVRTTKRL